MTPNTNNQNIFINPRKNMVEGIKRVQNFTNQQLYTKGFEFTAAAGVNNEFTLVLGGKARFLYGINVFINEQAFIIDPDKISLNINSEVIIDKVLVWAYTPWGGAAPGNIMKTNQFFDLPRFLSGSDSVLLNYEAINSHKFNIVFYLSDVNPYNK